MMYIKIDFLDKDALLPHLVANRKVAGVFFYLHKIHNNKTVTNLCYITYGYISLKLNEQRGGVKPGA